MKVVHFDYHAHATPHVERKNEIIQGHLDAGDTVIRVVCKGEMPICYANTNHALPKCALCVGCQNAAARLLSRHVPERSVIHLTPEDRAAIANFQFAGRTIAELKQLTFGEFDVGMAVTAAVVDQTRDPELDLTAHGQLVRDWLVVCLANYLSALNILDEEQPDRVYVPGGRVGYHRAVLRACQARGIDCYVHEFGGSYHRYYLAVNCLPQEITPWHQATEQAWDAADPAEREKVGRAFFEDKAIGKEWMSFVADQKKGLLPESWDPARRNIAVFLSSEFESVAISKEWDDKLYSDQIEALIKIIESLEARDAPVHLYVRVHPNEKGAQNRNMQRIRAIRSPKATIIPPESPISSYSLLWSCEKALVFGSTMGIEACYWGKPSVLAAPSFYQYLGGTYNAKSHEELIALLLAELAPKPREAALKYGYYWRRHGVEYVYFQPETTLKGKFKGKVVDVEGSWLWRKVLRWLDRPQLRLSNTLARASLGHRRLVYRRLGVNAVEDPLNQPKQDQPAFHKRVAEKALAAAFRCVFAFLYRPHVSARQKAVHA